MEPRDKNGLTEKEFLASYKPGDYERPSLTADIAVFSLSEKHTKILLIQRGGHPYIGSWALPGGFSEKGESIDETAKRELFEETGIADIPVTQIGLFSKPGRDPRCWVVSEAFLAVIPENRLSQLKAGDDAASAEWFSLNIERKDFCYWLYFSSENVKFDVQLLKRQNSTSFSERYEIIQNGGLAFDHAEIIAYALEKIALI